jgi:hypothetical protein
MLRDGKGLQYLATLLRRAGERVSVTELASVTGGDPEVAASSNHTAHERARSAVTKRIRDALQKIERNHPTLGRHLGLRVKTGYECVYSPDPELPVAWQL